jgi:hypothetical protein
MVAIYQTAYPRLKEDINAKELADVYTPKPEEKKFAMKHCKGLGASHLGLLVQLKMLQRLGRFVTFSEVPTPIIAHIKQHIRSRVTLKELQSYYSSGTKDRHVKLIRQYLNIKPYHSELTSQLVRNWALDAAKTKEALADIINVTIEHLIKESYELPTFRELERISQTARADTNNTFYQQLGGFLSEEGTLLIAQILQSSSGGAQGFGWSTLKT